MSLQVLLTPPVQVPAQHLFHLTIQVLTLPSVLPTLTTTKGSITSTTGTHTRHAPTVLENHAEASDTPDFLQSYAKLHNAITNPF